MSSVVFQIGYSDFPAKEYYLDEIWTNFDKALSAAIGYSSRDVEWKVVNGVNDSPVYRGTYTKKGNNFTSYVWIKPIVLNTPDHSQKFYLEMFPIEKYFKSKLTY